jgi:peroxiredoxin
MKKNNILWVFALLTLLIGSCNKEQDGASIEGVVLDSTIKGKVYLGIAGKHNTQFLDPMQIVDSTEIKDGKFSFKLKSTEPDIYRIAFKNYVDFNIYLVAGEGKITVKDISLQNSDKPYQLEGGNEKDVKLNHAFLDFLAKFNNELKNNTEFTSLKKQVDEAREQLDSLQTPAMKSKVDSLERAYEAKVTTFLRNFNKEIYRTIEENMPSVGSILLAEMLDLQRDYIFLKDFADKVAQQMPNSTPAKHFVEFMSRVKNDDLDKNRKGGQNQSQVGNGNVGLEIGNIAPDFTLKTPDDKSVSLTSLRGKVVLIDFWAAWCRPCRMENPNVVKAYQTYRAKGFDILGVSLDEDKEKWMKAIAQDKLTWTQVSDLKGWESDVARLYGVNGIPMNFLLDKDGKIIAKNLRGTQLEQTLDKVLK